MRYSKTLVKEKMGILHGMSYFVQGQKMKDQGIMRVVGIKGKGNKFTAHDWMSCLIHGRRNDGW